MVGFPSSPYIQIPKIHSPHFSNWHQSSNCLHHWSSTSRFKRLLNVYSPYNRFIRWVWNRFPTITLHNSLLSLTEWLTNWLDRPILCSIFKKGCVVYRSCTCSFQDETGKWKNPNWFTNSRTWINIKFFRCLATILNVFARSFLSSSFQFSHWEDIFQIKLIGFEVFDEVRKTLWSWYLFTVIW